VFVCLSICPFVCPFDSRDGTCQCPLTVKHILMECVDFNDVRNKQFVASSIKELGIFENVEAQNIVDVIKETHFFISNFNVFILMLVTYFLF